MARYLISLALVALVAACAETKYVSDGQWLLDNVSVSQAEGSRGADTGKLKSYLRQRPNAKWLATIRVPLLTYSMSGRDTTKWINRVLRRTGEQPVIFDSLKTAATADDMARELQNEGYLHATADYSVKTKGKRASVAYRVSCGERYSIAGVTYDIADTAIARIIEKPSKRGGLLRTGAPYSVNQLDEERKRITALLADRGYYKFHKEYITYLVDSIPGKRKINVELRISPPTAGGDTLAAHQVYHIGDVRFRETTDKEANSRIRQSLLTRNTFIESGDPYSNSALQKTYNRFARLQAVKYTNISFHERPDTTLLDCDVLVSAVKPHTISVQPEGTNTAGDLGAALSVTYQNRNLLRGSEVFSLQLRGAYEAIKGLEGYSDSGFEEFSAETRLLFPGLLAPLVSEGFRKRNSTSSEVMLRYDLQNRPEYHRRVLSAGWRYKWRDTNHHDSYQLDLLEINYVSMPWISETFKNEYLDNATRINAILRYNYEDIFIVKCGYGFAYNNGRWAIKANVESAGNFLELLSQLCPSIYTKKDNKNALFRIVYAQYVKADFDFVRNVQLDFAQTLVFHVGLGIAYPYGNCTILPFEKRYFSGGANSVRGWNVRRLGPGRYVGRDANTNFINQTGDFKLDLNMEYRARLLGKLSAALFVDAGNVWTLRKYDDQPGGQLTPGHFLGDLACAYGLGLRFNFDYFVLRFDFGMKAVDPAYRGKAHYPIVHPKLSRDFTFHFAVGLPF